MKEEDFEVEFWKKWLESDCLKRVDLIEKLPILKELLNMRNVKEAKHSFALIFNSLFEDLESAVYNKIKSKKKRKV